MSELRWYARAQSDRAYELTPAGSKAFEPLAAALLQIALKRKWVRQDLDSRVLTVTRVGRRELLARFGLDDIPG